MRKDEKIAGYVSKVQKLVHLMKGCGETLTDEMIVGKVMRTLIFHFDHIIVAIQESNNLETLKLEDLVDSLEAHAIMIVERKGIQDSIQALRLSYGRRMMVLTSSKTKSTRLREISLGWILTRIRLMIEFLNPRKEKKEIPIRKTKKRKKGVQCYNCEKWGHLVNHCWYRKGKGSTKGKEKWENLAHQVLDDSDDMVLMAAVADDHVKSKT